MMLGESKVHQFLLEGPTLLGDGLTTLAVFKCPRRNAYGLDAKGAGRSRNLTTWGSCEGPLASGPLNPSLKITQASRKDALLTELVETSLTDTESIS